MDVLNALHHIHEKEADIIYLDPPYESDLGMQILYALGNAPFVTDNTMIIVETALDTDYSGAEEAGLELLREKRYKTNRHLFFKKKAQE